MNQNLEQLKDILARARQEIAKVIIGQGEVVDRALIAIFTGQHALIEGVPGVAKTLLVRTLARTLGCEFSRIQFTPDLMPADITGTNVYNLQKNEFTLVRGPVFTSFLLADEINRASPKTQSAMLETMQENSVTLLGTTRALPQPFFVLASQNPIELEGTYPLPEAQLDRFLFRVMFDSVDADVLDRIISERRRGELPAPTWQMERGQLEILFQAMGKIYLPRPVSRYIARLVSATHPGAGEATEPVNRYVSYGASPRAAIAIAEAARAHALVDGRPSAGFEDVKAVAQPVLNHRLILNYQARFDHVTSSKLVTELLGRLDETGLNLPRDVELAKA